MDEPYRGELEVERDARERRRQALPERDDWVVERREDREQQVVLMLDTSLSMAGENLAIAAVAAAVLALKLRGEDLSVVVLREHGRRPQPPRGARRRPRRRREAPGQPARGYTNIEDALRVGSRELARGRNPRRAGLLITDGVFTAGGDPSHLAAAFPRLFVLLTEDYKMDEELCQRLAAIGHGDVFRVETPLRAAGADARDRQPGAALGRGGGAGDRPPRRPVRPFSFSYYRAFAGNATLSGTRAPAQAPGGLSYPTGGTSWAGSSQASSSWSSSSSRSRRSFRASASSGRRTAAWSSAWASTTATPSPAST